jgi:SAM-dependent methyltransferase
MRTTSEAAAEGLGFRTEGLQRIGQFFVDTGFLKDARGPRMLVIEGERYWRFMDFFYLPRPAARLNESAVVELCEMRRRFAGRCIDLRHNAAVAARIVDTLAPTLQPNSNVLDFGCGDGLSMKLVTANGLPAGVRLAGVDLSESAIEAARRAGFPSFLATIPFPFESGFFAAGYALFVLHFDIGREYLAELVRVLKPGAAFCFNIYNAPADRCRRRLLEAGFEHPQKRTSIHASRRHDLYCYTKGS